MELKYKWPVQGHQKQLKRLEHDLAHDRLSHAYLFAGPQHIGKMMVARTFAQILQCPNDFCHECAACTQIKRGQHIDTIELGDNEEGIKIGDIRELISHLSTTPSHRYKIVLIQNIERITPEAANAFLKNLEEPIHNVLFVLTTTRPKGLLDTILSRTRLVTFHPLPEDVIDQYIQTERPDIDDSTRRAITLFSMGRLGRTMSFIDDPDRLRFYQDIYHQISKFLERPGVNDRFSFVESITKNTDAQEVFLELFTHTVRGLLLEKLGGESISYSYAELFGMIERLDQARFDLNHNVNARLVLEDLVMSF